MARDFQINKIGPNQVSIHKDGKTITVYKDSAKNDWVATFEGHTLMRLPACTIQHGGTNMWQDRPCPDYTGQCFDGPDAHRHLGKYCHQVHGPRAVALASEQFPNVQRRPGGGRRTG